ncbi:MAG TPA: biopolymer transporter ExbD [Kofleriaceae bacterium]|nr:biopolymer transporter ExbD [Kofleriaceae bacterium]
MRHEPPRPEMNVTPLVDVVLVLLIIFMVIVPQMAAGATVDVPAAANFDPAKADVEPLTVSVTRSGHVYIEKSAVLAESLEPTLQQIRARDPYRRVRIKADKAAPYGYVRSVFKVCQGVGFPGVGLQVGDRVESSEG